MAKAPDGALLTKSQADTECSGRPRISVVLATPPGFNPGMVATELALLAFLRRHGWLSQTRFYRFVSMADRLSHLPHDQRATILSRSATGIEYRCAAENHDTLVGSDVVLFWADFHHMAQYIRAFERLAASGLIPNQRPETVRRLLLLANANDSTFARTVSFATTLLFNTAADEAAAEYGPLLRRLVRSSRRVWMRDALSAARVAHLRGDYERGYFCVDAGLLFRRDDLPVVSGGLVADTGAILLFLGRDRTAHTALLKAAQSLAGALNRTVGTLPWGDVLAFPMVDNTLTPPLLPETANTVELLRELACASLVVTDTYHLAVMAWNFGVPAICAFGGHTDRATDVSSGAAFNWRDKREVFFSQYDALDFLIRPEELHDSERLAARTRRLLEVAQNRVLCAAITAQMHAHAAASEVSLAGEITGLLAAASSSEPKTSDRAASV
jgi:hypothetical protein